MGRFAPAETVTGTVKSIQHITASLGSNATQNVSITAVSDVNKAYLISAGESTRSGVELELMSKLDLDITQQHKEDASTTNVALTIDNMDLWSGYTYYTSTGTYRGSVIEVT